MKAFYNVGWIRVRLRYVKDRGALINPEVIDITDDFLDLLKKLSTPYRLDHDSVYIYGYIANTGCLTTK